MNNSHRILLGGLSLVALSVVLRIGGNRFSRPPEGKITAPPGSLYLKGTNLPHQWKKATLPAMAVLYTNTDGAIFSGQVQTMKIETEKYQAMKAAMSETLQSLGIEPEDRIVQRLVGARIKADWSSVPESFRSAPDWAAVQSVKLKRAVAHVLKTEDALTIKRVLETDLGGPTLPPMADYELRDGPEAVFNEAKAIEKANL